MYWSFLFAASKEVCKACGQAEANSPRCSRLAILLQNVCWLSTWYFYIKGNYTVSIQWITFIWYLVHTVVRVCMFMGAYCSTLSYSDVFTPGRLASGPALSKTWCMWLETWLQDSQNLGAEVGVQQTSRCCDCLKLHPFFQHWLILIKINRFLCEIAWRPLLI